MLSNFPYNWQLRNKIKIYLLWISHRQNHIYIEKSYEIILYQETYDENNNFRNNFFQNAEHKKLVMIKDWYSSRLFKKIICLLWVSYILMRDFFPSNINECYDIIKCITFCITFLDSDRESCLLWLPDTQRFILVRRKLSL